MFDVSFQVTGSAASLRPGLTTQVRVTGDPIKGWSAGLVWVFFQSFILMIGGFIAPYIRKITPRAALLGTLAGVSVTFISMRPALEMYMTPQIGLVCFAIILVAGLFGLFLLLLVGALIRSRQAAAVFRRHGFFVLEN